MSAFLLQEPIPIAGGMIMANAKKLKSGNWRVLEYDYTDENNKRHYKSFTGSTKKEAEYMAKEYSHNKQRGAKTYNDLTLQEAYRRYIDSKSSVLAPSTIDGYEKNLRNDFKMLMPMKLSNINQEHIQLAVNEMSATKSPKSVRNSHGLLSAVLRAYKPQLILTTRLPQKVEPTYTIPTTEEINTLLANANDFIRVPILLASSGSLRRSEVCALTLNDVSDLGVTVNKAAVYDKNNNIVIKPPKTNAGNRFVPLPPHIIKEVKEWKYFGCSPAKLSDSFNRLVQQCNVPHISFHKLRHYFASELHACGIPDKHIAQIGGWKSVAVLQNIYQHTLRDKQEEMNKKIINIFQNNFTADSSNLQNQA